MRPTADFAAAYDAPAGGRAVPLRHGCALHRLFPSALLFVAPMLGIDHVGTIVDPLKFCLAIANLIAVCLLLPELRGDLDSYWQRVLCAERGRHVA